MSPTGASVTDLNRRRRRSSPLSSELRALAESPFPKEKADLVIAGKEDGSGVPVPERRAEIIAEHDSESYRLVPAAKLREVADALDEACARQRDDADLLAQFMRSVPVEQWPESLRRADSALASVGARVMVKPTP